MRIGEREYTIDDKGRLPTPPRYRGKRPKGKLVILTEAIGKCLILFSYQRWKSLEEYLRDMILEGEANELMKAIFFEANRMDLDEEGRITILPYLRSHLSIPKEMERKVIVIEYPGRLEIWLPSASPRERRELEKLFLQLSATLEKKGFRQRVGDLTPEQAEEARKKGMKVKFSTKEASGYGRIVGTSGYFAIVEREKLGEMPPKTFLVPCFSISPA